MEPLLLDMKVWTLNQTYEKIVNCIVTKPAYKLNWIYSSEFFLDKRLGLNSIYALTWYTFTDCITIRWIDYYYCNNWTKSKIISSNWVTFTDIYPTWFDINSSSPIKLVKWKWVYWTKKISLVVWSWITFEQSNDWNTFTSLPWYTWWYVVVPVTATPTWVVEWDYMNFTWTSVLKWWVNKIFKVDWNNLFILWTNIRWTIPKAWDTIDIYSDTSNNILVWHSTWVSIINLNWLAMTTKIDVLITSSIKDIVNYDWNIFALTENQLYYTRSTFDDNVQFYPLDFFKIDNWYKLFVTWKSLLVFADTNKLIASANSTWWVSVWYVWYDVNYNWNVFSKYSTIFADQTIYIIQDDKQIMQVDIKQNNNTSFELFTKNIMTWNRWILEDISWWEIFISSTDRFLNIFYVSWSTTTNYQYDKQYNHWLYHTYAKKIYWTFKSYNNWYVLFTNWNICTQSWYTDIWTSYSQEVSFMSSWWIEQMNQPAIVRTLFWFVPVPFNVNLNIKIEIWWTMEEINNTLSSYEFDNRLSWWAIPEWQVTYNGNLISLQTAIYKLWRFITFKYSWSNRFSIWPSYILQDKTKIFVNEYNNKI